MINIIELGGGGGGGAGAIVVADNHRFVDAAARDAYFVAHPSELADDLYVVTGTQLQQYDLATTAWLDMSAVIKGDKGDKGDTGANGANGTNGTNGVDGVDGTNGVDGVDGVDGSNGARLRQSATLSATGTQTINMAVTGLLNLTLANSVAATIDLTGATDYYYSVMIILNTGTGNSVTWKIGGVVATVLNPNGTVFTPVDSKKYQLGVVNITGTTMTLNVLEVS